MRSHHDTIIWIWTSTPSYHHHLRLLITSYFSLNGKLVNAGQVLTKSEITGYVVRAFKPGPPPTSKLTRRFLFPNRILRVQKHILDLFPDMLQNIASSRIQFYVMRPGYSGMTYVGFKSFISKQAWLAEIDNLGEHETVGIEVRPSVSVSESVSSFFNRTRFL